MRAREQALVVAAPLINPPAGLEFTGARKRYGWPLRESPRIPVWWARTRCSTLRSWLSRAKHYYQGQPELLAQATQLTLDWMCTRKLLND